MPLAGAASSGEKHFENGVQLAKDPVILGIICVVVPRNALKALRTLRGRPRRINRKHPEMLSQTPRNRCEPPTSRRGLNMLNTSLEFGRGDIVDNDGPDAMHKHSHKDAEYRRVEVITGQKRRKRRGVDAAIFVDVSRGASGFGYAARDGISDCLDAAQLLGSSECSSLALVRPDTTRSSTSVSHAIQSMPFNFAVWISVIAIDQWRAPPSLPAKSEFLRVNVCGLIAPGPSLSPSRCGRRPGMQPPGPMADGVAHGLCQIGRAGDTVNVNTQPVVQGLDERSTSVLSDTSSLLGGLAADLSLDRVEGRDTLQDFGRERRLRRGMELEERPPHVDPAEGQADRLVDAVTGQALEAVIAVHLQHAGELGEMGGGAHVLAILGIDVGHGRMGRSTPGTVVDRVSRRGKAARWLHCPHRRRQQPGAEAHRPAGAEAHRAAKPANPCQRPSPARNVTNHGDLSRIMRNLSQRIGRLV